MLAQLCITYHGNTNYNPKNLNYGEHTNKAR